MGSIQSTFLLRAGLGIALAISFAAANAVTDDLSFSAIAAGGSTSSGPSATNTQFSLTLNSVNSVAATSFSVSAGDTIDATVTFDQATNIPIPANATYTILGLTLQGTGFDASPVISTQIANASASLAGSSIGGSPYASCETSSQICEAGIYFGAGTLTNLSFDTYTTQFTVTTLAAPVTITAGDLDAYSALPAAPVPEPETYALIAVGIVFLGFTARGRAASAKFKFARAA